MCKLTLRDLPVAVFERFKKKMRGSLHYAVHSLIVNRFGRDDDIGGWTEDD
jgi:hypothetical protein